MTEVKGAVRKRVGRPRKFQSDAEKLKAHRDSMMKIKSQVRVFLDPLDKKSLVEMCEENGMTQGEMITQLIRSAIRN
ncbi:MAG: replication protein [Candidatus Symbiopectobacterium sp. Dall1.0]|nr:replication protein [Candidatus Symbiopectobacterium sp. Dall1.0]